MDAWLEKEEKRGPNKMLLAGVGIAILVIGTIVGLLYLRPTTQEVKQQVLEGAFLEGTPEFEALTRKIIIYNDAANTLESPTGLGTITMFTRSIISNNSDKTLTALEIRVSVVDPFDKVIKEKTVTVVPSQSTEVLYPQEKLPVSVAIEGFAKDADRARVKWKVTAIKVQS